MQAWSLNGFVGGEGTGKVKVLELLLGYASFGCTLGL